MVQLGQGLSAGALRGDELNSVMEQLPRLGQALTKHLGITAGALRDFASTGQLTTEIIQKALESQAESIGADFAK
ncbi:tape measure protein, partial [Streptomyces caeruleatus]